MIENMTNSVQAAGAAFRCGQTVPIENFWSSFDYDEPLPIKLGPAAGRPKRRKNPCALYTKEINRVLDDIHDHEALQRVLDFAQHQLTNQRK